MEGKSILSFISSGLTLLSFPPFNLTWVAAICLIPLMAGLERRKALPSPARLSEGFKAGYQFGLFFMTLGHLWFFELTQWAPLWIIIGLWLALSVYLSLFFGIITAIYTYFKCSVWTFPFFWILGEYLRTLGPFGDAFGQLGYTLTAATPFLQWASIGGIYFLSFLVVFANCHVQYIWQAFIANSPRIFITQAIKSILILCLFYFGGVYLLKDTPSVLAKTSISIIQANHSQASKLESSEWPALRKDYISLIKQAKQSTPRYIFLPETITPGFNLEDTNFMSMLTPILTPEITVLLGTSERTPTHTYYNSVKAITSSGVLDSDHKKQRLMPFGEYIPLRSLLEKLPFGKLIPEADFSFGPNPIPISTSAHKIGATICLETIFPYYFRELTLNGADIFFSAVNNAWFFDSSAAQKHLQMSIVRAVENNRFMIQSANTGISAVITNKGEIQAQTALNTVAILNETITIHTDKTVYTRHGNWILFLALIVTISDIFKKYRHRLR